MAGIRIRHATARSTMTLVPVLSRPLGAGPNDICPGCRLMFGLDMIHGVKTVHLWVDDTGVCIVSRGVLEDLRLAGLPDITILDEVKKPPPLSIGVPREAQDYEARTIIYRR